MYVWNQANRADRALDTIIGSNLIVLIVLWTGIKLIVLIVLWTGIKLIELIVLWTHTRFLPKLCKVTVKGD